MTEYNIAATGKGSIAAHTITGSVSTGEPAQSVPTNQELAIVLDAIHGFMKKYSMSFNRNYVDDFIPIVKWTAGDVRGNIEWAAMVVDETSDDMFLLERVPGRDRVKVEHYVHKTTGFVRD